VRLSILHLLCEIFVTVPFRRAAHIIMVVTAMWYLGVFITFFAICRPFDFDWRSDERGVYGNFFLSFLLSAIFNLFLDLCIIVLPMPMLWRLQMPISRKISLMIIFGIHGVSSLSTIQIF